MRLIPFLYSLSELTCRWLPGLFSPANFFAAAGNLLQLLLHATWSNGRVRCEFNMTRIYAASRTRIPNKLPLLNSLRRMIRQIFLSAKPGSLLAAGERVRAHSGTLGIYCGRSVPESSVCFYDMVFYKVVIIFIRPIFFHGSPKKHLVGMCSDLWYANGFPGLAILIQLAGERVGVCGFWEFA